MVKKVSKNNTGKAVGVAAGMAAVGVAAYLLFGPEGKKNKKLIKSWAVKMKADILEKIENLEEVTSPVYEKIVDEVGNRYKKLKNINLEDLEKEIATFKKNWKDMERKSKSQVRRVNKKVVAPAKEVVEKSGTKKITKK